MIVNIPTIVMIRLHTLQMKLSGDERTLLAYLLSSTSNGCLPISYCETTLGITKTKDVANKLKRHGSTWGFKVETDLDTVTLTICIPPIAAEKDETLEKEVQCG
ncbi:hypothetical protein [Desulfosediminicola ganghwensis]|uniref:hypothetical protein n=1 Tax=Desulfosediminicola ganghwensis TaxID=2569540 RepID=UPI0010AD7671|nr:hypothetical protein [Desulfosediminicola ganghwensis]